MTPLEQNGPVLTAVSSHQFVLQSHYTLAVDPVSSNGLIWPCPKGGEVIVTGISDGDVIVTVAKYARPPPVKDEAWDTVVEVSVLSAEAELCVCSLDAEPPPIPPMTSEAGTYRVLAHAAGRDSAYDLATSEVTEHYLLEVWPAPPAPQILYKQSDDVSAAMGGDET